MTQACSHLDQIDPAVKRDSEIGCSDCLAIGGQWVHLRECMICGHVACCDSSPNQHASKHFDASGHPVMRSLEPGESWWWCYVDEVAFSFGEP
ncbi:MAG: UBP-type zinc finger domain-containing protein [Solirubrobacteraceae bacterium]|jgi:uncharacterized UBP type Zn finger protein